MTGLLAACAVAACDSGPEGPEIDGLYELYVDGADPDDEPDVPQGRYAFEQEGHILTGTFVEEPDVFTGIEGSHVYPLIEIDFHWENDEGAYTDRFSGTANADGSLIEGVIVSGVAPLDTPAAFLAVQD
jgi:hypothetical protein